MDSLRLLSMELEPVRADHWYVRGIILPDQGANLGASLSFMCRFCLTGLLEYIMKVNRVMGAHDKL